jgi:hypothetical protein
MVNQSPSVETMNRLAQEIDDRYPYSIAPTLDGEVMDDGWFLISALANETDFTLRDWEPVGYGSLQSAGRRQATTH